MKNRITFSKPNGDWGIEGVELAELSPKLYGALMKLKKYEDTGLDPYEVEDLKQYEKIDITIEQLRDFDKVYLEKCEEVNRLAAELKGNKERIRRLKEKMIILQCMMCG